jgi:hypothetical protein
MALLLIMCGMAFAAKGVRRVGPTDFVAANPPPPPSNVFPPLISGGAAQGQALTESHGTWTNAPTSYSFQWEDCDGSGQACVAIAGATGASYVLTAADVGHTIVVQETASNSGGSGTPADSAPTAVVLPAVPSNVLPPTIAGTSTQGQTLIESHGAWTNNPSSYTYVWYDCDGSGGSCVPISGASGQTYTLTAADVGHTVRVGESADNAGGTSVVFSAATALVQPVAGPPVVPVGPSLAQIRALLSTALRVHGTLSTIGQILKHRGYALSVRVPGAGKLKILWYFRPRHGRTIVVAGVTMTFQTPGRFKIRLVLTGKGRTLLARATHLKLSAAGSFTSAGMTQASSTRTLTLTG